LSLANQGFGFRQSFCFNKVGHFLAVVIFQVFVRFKIGLWFLFQKFRVKLAQVSKIGFKVFSSGFGRQAVSFGKVRFSWLAFCLGKSGF
jgi:hypothetical protein